MISNNGKNIAYIEANIIHKNLLISDIMEGKYNHIIAIISKIKISYID